MGWTTEKLKQLHTSVPANPLLAEPLYLAGYIERMGTGTTDMVRKSVEAGLAEPQFIQSEDFRSIVFRPGTPEATPQVTPQVTDELQQKFRSTSVEVRKLVTIMAGELKRLEIQHRLELSHEGNFRENYLEPALNEELIEMIYPQRNHPNQKYRLTPKGQALQELLKKKN